MAPEKMLKVCVRPQKFRNPDNEVSWKNIEKAVGANETASFAALCSAVQGHIHGDKSKKGPAAFIKYCMRQGWLELT